MRIHHYLLCGLLPLGVGCQTNEVKEFSRLHLGMDKGEVVDIMGSPRRSDRRFGEDRWTYVFSDQGQEHKKEVRFSDGKSIYVGDFVPPSISAEEQDRRNEKENLDLEAQQAARRAEFRSESHKYFQSNDESVTPHVPQFTPVQ